MRRKMVMGWKKKAGEAPVPMGRSISGSRKPYDGCRGGGRCVDDVEEEKTEGGRRWWSVRIRGGKREEREGVGEGGMDGVAAADASAPWVLQERSGRPWWCLSVPTGGTAVGAAGWQGLA